MSNSPRVVRLRETLAATDDLLVLCRRDNEAVDMVAALMGEQRFGEMIAELQKLRARLVSELELKDAGAKSVKPRKRRLTNR
jgi:hypothetical protein